jgi:hypothetical protein
MIIEQKIQTDILDHWYCFKFVDIDSGLRLKDSNERIFFDVSIGTRKSFRFQLHHCYIGLFEYIRPTDAAGGSFLLDVKRLYCVTTREWLI